jgi:hypothetical protein
LFICLYYQLEKAITTIQTERSLDVDGQEKAYI